MKSWDKYSRRALLKGMGATTALSPFVPLFEADAEAAGGSPKRILFLWVPLGAIDIEKYWAPTGSEFDFKLSAQMAPLEPHKNDLIIIKGLGISGSLISRSAQSGGHQAASPLIMTGVPNIRLGADKRTARGGGISIDQHIANAVGKETPFKSLYLSVYEHNQISQWTGSYTGRSAPVTPENNPSAVFTRLFGSGAAVKPPAGATSAAPDPAAEDRKSVLDFVRQNINGLKPKVGQNDWLKLQGHLDTIRDLEVSLERRANITCDAQGVDSGSPATDVPLSSKALSTMTVKALACDLTRVSVLHWATWKHVFKWLPGISSLGAGATFHDLSHNPNRAIVDPTLNHIKVWHFQEIAKLFDQMKSVSDGTGTLLDNTLVVWFSEFNHPDPHDMSRIPAFFAGGKNVMPGRRGRYVTVGNRPHNDLYATAQRAMGLPDQKFGDPGVSQGPLTQIFG